MRLELVTGTHLDSLFEENAILRFYRVRLRYMDRLAAASLRQEQHLAKRFFSQ
jgi:hypothetical protein